MLNIVREWNIRDNCENNGRITVDEKLIILKTKLAFRHVYKNYNILYLIAVCAEDII